MAVVETGIAILTSYQGRPILKTGNNFASNKTSEAYKNVLLGRPDLAPKVVQGTIELLDIAGLVVNDWLSQPTGLWDLENGKRSAEVIEPTDPIIQWVKVINIGALGNKNSLKDTLQLNGHKPYGGPFLKINHPIHPAIAQIRHRHSLDGKVLSEGLGWQGSQNETVSLNINEAILRLLSSLLAKRIEAQSLSDLKATYFNSLKTPLEAALFSYALERGNIFHQTDLKPLAKIPLTST